MREKNPQLEFAMNTLYDKLKGQPYGSTFSWDLLRSMCGVENLVDYHLYYIVNKVNLLLNEHEQRYLQSVHGIGKRIIYPEEHTIVAKKEVKKSVRIYKKAGIILNATPLDKLNEEQKKEVIESANRYKTMQLFATEILKKKKIREVEKESLVLDILKEL